MDDVVGPGSVRGSGEVEAGNIAGRDVAADAGQHVSLSLQPVQTDDPWRNQVSSVLLAMNANLARACAGLEEARRDREEDRKDINAIRVILLGNGDGREGIVSQVRNVRRWLPVFIFAFSLLIIWLTVLTALLFTLLGGA